MNWRDRLLLYRAIAVAGILLFAVAGSSVYAEDLEISDVSVTRVEETSVTVTWNTSVPADSAVAYGNSTALGASVSSGTFGLDHSLVLSGLEPGRWYYYEVQSTSQDRSQVATDDSGGFYHRFLTDDIPSAVDGLFISVVGMAAVFVVLIFIMLLMVWIELSFRAKPIGADPGALFAPDVEDRRAGGRSHGAGAAGGTGVADLDSMLMSIGVEVEHRPEDGAEVAAIALAIASHMKERGRDLHGHLTINDIEYHVSVGPPWDYPVPIVVDGEKYWASLDGRGLPVGGGSTPLRVTRIGDAQRGRQWRSAYPMPIGTPWDRRGWTRRT